jgi:hypothetical protein
MNIKIDRGDSSEYCGPWRKYVPGEFDMNVAERILDLRRHCDDDSDCTAQEVIAAVCDLMSEIVCCTDAENDILQEYEERIRAIRCEMQLDHEWIYDHCCFWGHQYCTNCRKAKYPTLVGLLCSEACELVGGKHVTEAEWVSRQPAPRPDADRQSR